MSAATIAAVHEAIAAHAADIGKDGLVTEWIVGYTVQQLDDEAGMPNWNYDYTTSQFASPHGTIGLVSALETLVHESIWAADEDD